MKDADKKKSKVNDLFAKYVVDTIAKSPLAFIPIIQAMLDPKSPDSIALHKLIAESMVTALTNNDEIKNTVLTRILEFIQNITDKEVFKIVNQQRLQLEADSKEFIKSIQERITVTLCENYFKEKQAKIDEIFDDYFKDLKKSVQNHIDALDAKTKEVIAKKSGENSVSIEVPNHMKGKVIEYLKFLQSQG